MSYRLRDYQQQAVDAVWRDWTAGEKSVAIELPTGGGKGHPLDTRVPTPNGMLLWGELRVGDRVYGSDGRPTTVTAVFDRGVLPTYRVTFSDGASVETDGDHLWRVRRAEFRRTSREWAIMSTAELAAADLKPGRGHRFHVPMTGAVEGAESDLPIDPYVVGALIANGGMTSGGTMLTTPDDEVIERVRRHEVARRINDTTDVCPRYNLPGLIPVTRMLGLRVPSAAKRIPVAYLSASAPQRLALLQGLMDGDGSARGRDRRSVLYHTTSPVLADQVSELVTSFGGTGSVRRSDRGVKGVEFTVGILLPAGISPFGTSRKGLAGTDNARGLQPKRAVVRIERVEDKPIRCITVAAADSLYLVTEQHIVTHNTMVMADVSRRLVERGGRVLLAAHREELVDQALRDLRLVMPGGRFGRTQGAVKQTAGVDVAVGMIQTFATAPGLRAVHAGGFNAALIDEAHHAAAPSYRKVLGALPAGAYTLGVSATLARTDRLSLGEVFGKISYVKPITEMIREGWLVRPRGRHVFIDGLDLRKVRKRGGDFADGALATAMKDAMAPEAVCRAWLEHARGRQTVGFAPTVELAYLFAEAFRAEGVKARAIHGDQSAAGKAERREAVAAFRRGEIEVLWNVGVLTEGFDAPETSCVIMARPTTSAVLFTQCVGRGLRLAEGKTDCVILDVVGVLGKHRLASLASLDGAASPEDVPDDLLAYEDEPDGEPADDEAIEFGDDEPDGGTFVPEFVDGRLSWAEIDLIEESALNWLRSEGGTPFLLHGNMAQLTGRALFPVYRTDGRVLLAEVPVATEGGRWAGEPDGYAGMAEAMTAAEKLVHKGGAIRRGYELRSEWPSKSQRIQAESWGLKVPSGLTWGDVQDMINTHAVSQRIDHLEMVQKGYVPNE